MTSGDGGAMPQVVTYDGLPAGSGGAHGLRVRRLAEARDRVQGFLDACTEPDGPGSWRFEVAAGGDPESTASLVDAAGQLLGGPRRRTQTGTEWGVRPEAVDAVIDLLTAAGPAATRYGASLGVLRLDRPVRLLDPVTGTPWTDLSPEATGGFAVDGYGRRLGASGVRATYGTASSALSLWLSLPADDRLAPAARHVQEHVPVRLSAKHWRLCTPTRAGDGYRSAKIASPLATR